MYVTGAFAARLLWSIQDESSTSETLFITPRYYDGTYTSFYTVEVGGGEEFVEISEGWTKCPIVVSTDGTNTGYSSAEYTTCMTTPIDDADLLQSPKDWATVIKKGAFRHTVTRTKKKGSILQLRDAVFTDLAVVATRCPGCGRIEVKVGQKTKEFSLDSNSIKRKQLFKWAPDVSGETHTISIKVLSDGKSVDIDGLGVIDRSSA
jgi:uncharacterized protein YbbK (DUF523 family)